MGEAIVFTMAKVGNDKNIELEISEAGVPQPIARYSLSRTANAQAHLEYLQREHANGRVAQSRCCHGGPCDWDRIVDPEHYIRRGTRKVILCAAHTQVLDEARRRVPPNDLAHLFASKA